MTVHVRRNVWTLPDGDLTLAHYAAAVAEMKSRDPQDPTSWFYQAAMHKTTVTPPKPLWNGCQHGSWFFLPWHRMYLYFFERIVRATVVDLGGPDDWALPFWAYDTGGTQARIPAAFRDPQGGTNPSSPSGATTSTWARPCPSRSPPRHRRWHAPSSSERRNSAAASPRTVTPSGTDTDRSNSPRTAPCTTTSAA